MARCEEYVSRYSVCVNCNNKAVDCGKEKCPVYKAPTADVVPKSKYDLAVAEREANVKGFAEELAKMRTEVARGIFAEIEQVQKEIVDRMQEFINEWKQYSESTVDYFGGKYDAMETASRIVKSILTDKTAELKKKYTEEKK